MSRPLLARIDLSAFKQNLAVARGHAPRSRAFAVIKANGYGHGMLRAAHALSAAEGFAVLNLGEAVALREAGFSQAILLLEGFFSADELLALAEYRIATVIHSIEQLEMLEMSGLPVKLEVFLKINSGMNRLGVQPPAFPHVLLRLQSCPAVGRINLMTHFATADASKGTGEALAVDSQLACFNAVAEGHDFPRSLANSAAILGYPQTHADWVRPGIMLYGSSPLAEVSAEALGLKPVMTLKSEVIAVQELQAGDAVGYGGIFKADKAMRVGIVACGYADGYPRHAPTGTPVLLNGARSRLLGRVSMDMLCVDMADIPGAGVGSPVVLWGEGLSVDEVASAAGTIGYELLCALAPRVPIEEVA